MENKKVFMDRFVQFINTADERLAEVLIAPNAKFYVPGQSDPMQGPGGYLSIIGMMRSGFPDIQWTLEDIVAEEEKVAARYIMRGTHQGSFFGLPPTEKSIQVQAINFYRLSNNQIIEEFGQPDMLGLLQQIGAAPGA